MAGVTAVVHCAVGSGRDTDVITAGTRNVLEAAQRAGAAHLIQMSSIAVHDAALDVVSETSPTDVPQGAYGAAKLAAEKTLHAGGSDLGISILRPTLIYGPGSAQWTTFFVDRMRSGGWHALGAGGEGTANLIHVDDLAGFVAHLLSRPAPDGVETYIVNGEDAPSWNAYLEGLNTRLDLPPLLASRGVGRVAQLARKAIRVGDKVMPRLPVVRAPWRQAQNFGLNLPSGDELARFAATTRYDTSRMREAGYVPPTTLAHGLETIARFYGA
jgi:UDP-glucose 4-epimerase